MIFINQPSSSTSKLSLLYRSELQLLQTHAESSAYCTELQLLQTHAESSAYCTELQLLQTHEEGVIFRGPRMNLPHRRSCSPMLLQLCMGKKNPITRSAPSLALVSLLGHRNPTALYGHNYVSNHSHTSDSALVFLLGG